MSIYPKTPNGATTDGINHALEYSKNPGSENPYLTLNDISGAIIISPNGTKYTIVVANNGTLSTTAV